MDAPPRRKKLVEEPRAITRVEANPILDGDTEPIELAPVKRKRGRPRKNKPVEPEEAPQPEQKQEEKKELAPEVEEPPAPPQPEPADNKGERKAEHQDIKSAEPMKLDEEKQGSLESKD